MGLPFLEGPSQCHIRVSGSTESLTRRGRTVNSKERGDEEKEKHHHHLYARVIFTKKKKKKKLVLVYTHTHTFQLAHCVLFLGGHEGAWNNWATLKFENFISFFFLSFFFVCCIKLFWNITMDHIFKIFNSVYLFFLIEPTFNIFNGVNEYKSCLISFRVNYWFILFLIFRVKVFFVQFFNLIICSQFIFR